MRLQGNLKSFNAKVIFLCSTHIGCNLLNSLVRDFTLNDNSWFDDKKRCEAWEKMLQRKKEN